MKKEEGFTLLEVLIALVILGIGFAILTQGYITINDGMDRNQNYSFISSWAGSKLNEITAGIELNTHGSFTYRDIVYNWWTEENYLDEGLKEIRLIVEEYGRGDRGRYSLTRLIIRSD